MFLGLHIVIIPLLINSAGQEVAEQSSLSQAIATWGREH